MPKVKINRKLEPIFTAKQQIIVVIGGRGSGKSIGIGDILTIKMDTENADIYCLREFQDSVNDSVHRVFQDSIRERLQLTGWDIQENKVIAPGGARTNYKGANRNPDSMQSAQGYKYSWFEESHRASQNSLDKLLPTILRNPGAKCIFTANPQSSADPFSQRFINPYKRHIDKYGFYADDLHLIIKCNWRDNPWWNDEQEALRKWDFENLSRAKYRWIWEGDFNDEVEDSIIKAEWFDACINAHKKLPAIKPRGAVICAYDPMDDGGDAHGFAVRHGSIITRVSCRDSGEIDEGCDWATGEAIKHGCDLFTWDLDGMGTGLKRQVDTAFNGKKVEVSGFRGSLSGIGQDNGDKKLGEKTYAETYKNNRAQYYDALAKRCFNTYRAVEKGEYIDPDEMISFDSMGIEDIDRLRSEVCRIPTKPNANGLIQIMSKQDMKKEGIASPNMADAIMMTMITPKPKKQWGKLNYQKVGIA
jgi:phage terminase large subunit